MNIQGTGMLRPCGLTNHAFRSCNWLMQDVLKYYIALQVICQDDIWSRSNPQIPGRHLPEVHPIRPSAPLCVDEPESVRYASVHDGRAS